MSLRACALLAALPLFGSCMLIPGPPPEVPELQQRFVAPGDVLHVTDRATPGEPLAILTVSEEGAVDVPGIGTLPVLGCTTEDVESVLLSLQDEDQPDLAVEIVTPSRNYWVYGEVQRAGRRPLHGPVTVREAVAHVRPRGQSADLQRVRLYRADVGSPLEFTIDLTRGAGEIDHANDVVLRDGDVLLVPPLVAGTGREAPYKPGPE